MNRAGVIFGLVCLAVAVILVLWNRVKTRKTMDTLDKMLEQAKNGTFREENFDETRLSALEMRFFQYLTAGVTSAENVRQEKDKIKSLIGDISHQTKTPIANLLLYTELLQEEALSEEAMGSARAIREQAEKLRFLIDSLVKLSRLENGILTLSPEKQPIGPMLESVCNAYQRKAEDKGLYLQVQPTEESAVFDGKWTAEALGNLLDNAIKYTREGGITVKTTPYELFLRLDITDTGMGIPEEEQAKIFTRFYRSEAVKEQEGVGIGLYLTREIVSRQGGYLKVSSETGKGSTFSVFLPR